MRCPHCNAENENNAIFCTECDGWILGTMYVDENEPQLPEETDRDPIVSRKKWVIPVLVGALVLITAIVALVMLPFSNGYIHRSHSIYYASANGRMHFLYNGSVLETDIAPQSFNEHSICMDGSAAVFLDTANNLLLVQEGQVRSIAENVNSYRLSAAGGGIAYTTTGDHKCLYHYDPETNVSTPLMTADTISLADYVISPNGYYVAFIDRTAQTKAIRRYGNGKTITIHEDSPFQIISISDNGKYIYAYEDRIVSFDAKGNMTTVGDFSNNAFGIGASASFASSIVFSSLFYLNADHSQLMYYHDGITYLSRNGHAATVFCEANVTPVMPALTSVYSNYPSNTCPMDDLREKIYIEVQYLLSDIPTISSLLPIQTNLWHIGKESTLLASDVGTYWLDPTGKHLYFTDKDSALQSMSIGSKKGPLHIADDVSNFSVSYDCSRVYFQVKNHVYSCDGEDGSDKTQISANPFYGLMMTKDNILYYRERTGTLYAIVGNQEPEAVLENAIGCTLGDDGTLYIFAEDALYISTREGGVKKVLTTNSNSESN